MRACLKYVIQRTYIHCGDMQPAGLSHRAPVLASSTEVTAAGMLWCMQEGAAAATADAAADRYVMLWFDPSIQVNQLV